jgi:hypothetical protein
LSCLAQGAETQTFRTGLVAEYRSFAISPDGDYLIFTTAKLADGMRLLDLKTGAIKILPPIPGRTREMPRWSSDSKRLVAISTLVAARGTLN